MLLSDFFENAPETEISQLSIDSRLPMHRCMFFCLNGIRYNGHDYIDEAIKNGASVIVYDEDDIDTERDAIFIKVSDVVSCLNDIAPKFYNYPANEINTYIVGGCLGKSSIAYLIKSFLNNYEMCGSIGIMGIEYGDKKLLNSAETLTILDNQKYLADMLRSGVKSCTFETNALSLTYKKLDSINPDVFVYASTDSGSFDYQELGNRHNDVYSKYFYSLEDSTAIILNCDDEAYNELSLAAGNNCFSYGMQYGADYRIDDVKLFNDHSSFDIVYENNRYHYETKIVSINNVYNLTAAIAALHTQGYDLNELSCLTPFIEPLEGVVYKADLPFNIYIDCAYCLKSYKDIFEFANNIVEDKGRVIAIVSINSTDEENRLEELCDLCLKYLDETIVTVDYARDDIGPLFDYACELLQGANYLLVDERKQAIEMACELLNSKDVLLILGKGNENTLSRSLGRISYEGDLKNCLKTMNKRIKEENEEDDYY